MTRRTLLAAPAAMAAASGAQSSSGPVNIGSRRELFADRFLIDRMTGTSLKPGQPVDAGPVLYLDRPWEGRFCGYGTIIKDGDTYRLYYRGVPNAGGDGRDSEVYCYAESKDGVRFTRPELNLHEAHGARRNNVILAHTPPLQHNFCPMLDSKPGVPASHRFKALAGTRRSGLVAYRSADGIHWEKIREQPVLTEGAFDSQNLAFWAEAEGRYVCYYRTFKKIGATSYRWISRATSDDFVNWTRGEEMSFGDAPPEHLYTNQTSPYFRAPHIYIAICARFLPNRQVLSDAEAKEINVDPGYFKDCSDAVMLTSRGGLQYDRTFLEALLRPGLGVENWVSRSNYPVLNVVPTGPNEMSLYVVRNYGQPSIYIRRYTLRPDGFASVHAPYSGGEMITKPFRFTGSKLLLNFSTSAPGGIRTEIQDESGAPVAGFSLDDSVEMIGDQIERAAAWKGGSGTGRLAGKTIRLRFAMKDADLFALRFG
jgi:hypothetical protein